MLAAKIDILQTFTYQSLGNHLDGFSIYICCDKSLKFLLLDDSMTLCIADYANFQAHLWNMFGFTITIKAFSKNKTYKTYTKTQDDSNES